MSPISLLLASTTGSFSILLSCRISSASAMEVPSRVVTRFSEVMTSEMGRSLFFSKRRSRLVTIPIRCPASSTIGMPPMLCSFMLAFASRTRASDGSVTGSRIIPLSARFTLRTLRACCSMVIFLCSTPMPPSRAMAIAMLDSVTVSMAAETIGMLMRMLRVNWVVMSTSLGRISE